MCLYFHNKLYRGNRVTKVDTGSFNAFASPNLAPLANAEVDITSKLANSRQTFQFIKSRGIFYFIFFKSVLSLLSSVNWDTVWRANTTAKFQVCTELNRNVGLLRLFPGITAATVSIFGLIWVSRGCPCHCLDMTLLRDVTSVKMVSAKLLSLYISLEHF